jgi:hypothetical protein
VADTQVAATPAGDTPAAEASPVAVTVASVVAGVTAALVAEVTAGGAIDLAGLDWLSASDGKP